MAIRLIVAGALRKDLSMEVTERDKISIIQGDPKRVGSTPEGLTEPQQVLREAIVNRFTINKMRRYITEQLNYITYYQHVTEGVQMLFDERGNPPANAPIPTIIETREKLEGQLSMLEAVCSALRAHIVELKEIENAAFELFKQQQDTA
jgi:hypothetical protein